MISEKMNNFIDNIIIYAPTETLICKECGIEYISRGKKDNGICRACERKKNVKFKGGPLDNIGSDKV